MKPLKQEAIDQTLHFMAAAVVTAIAGVDLLGGLVVGLALGSVRELTEEGDMLSSGSLRDILFWTLGGAFGGLLS